jgi:hypothetical protein
MKNQNPRDRALYAARWIDQRLREVVLHFQPTAEAISEAHRTLAPEGSAAGPHGFRRERQLLAVKIRDMRGRVISEADSLIKIRRQISAGATPFPKEPPDVIGELERIRRKHNADMEKLAAECDWFERSFEYHVECQRCDHDGDVRPSLASYGLEQRPGDDGE